MNPKLLVHQTKGLLMDMPPLTCSRGVSLLWVSDFRALTVLVHVTGGLWKHMQMAGKHEFPYELFQNHTVIQQVLAGSMRSGHIRQDYSELSAAYLAGEETRQACGVVHDTTTNVLRTPDAQMHATDRASLWRAALMEHLHSQHGQGLFFQIVHLPEHASAEDLQICLRLSYGENLIMSADALPHNARQLFKALPQAERLTTHS